MLSRLLSFSLGCSSSLKPSLSSQWSLIQSFVRDFFCISFVWLCSQREMSQTKLMQKKSLVRSFIQGSWLKLQGLKPSWIVVLFTLNACCTIVSIFFNPFSWHVKNLPSQRILCESTKNKLPVRQFIMHEKGGHSKVNVFFFLFYTLLFIYLFQYETIEDSVPEFFLHNKGSTQIIYTRNQALQAWF